MLVVPALELGHPVVLYILMEANDVPVNSCHAPTCGSDRRRRTSPDAALNVVSSIRSIECQSPSLYSEITGTNSIPLEVERLVIARYAETVWRSPFESMTVN